MSQSITLNVEGMTCDHCVHAVTTALQEVTGVEKASVELEAKRAVVEGDGLDAAQLIAAIEEEGYEAAVTA